MKKQCLELLGLLLVEMISIADFFFLYTYPTTLLNLVVFLCFSLLGNLFVKVFMD